MNADEFNKKELEEGRITASHITALTKSYQEQQKIVPLDGKLGTDTRKRLIPAVLNVQDHTTLTDYSAVGLKALELAILELGKGETGKNNAGPDVLRYRGGVVDDEGAWCADLQSYLIIEAIAELKLDLKFSRKRGALALYEEIGDLGSFVKVPSAGDYFCISRVGGHHIGIIETYDGIAHTIEGNVGDFPSKVQRLKHDFGRDASFVGYASFRK